MIIIKDLIKKHGYEKVENMCELMGFWDEYNYVKNSNPRLKPADHYGIDVEMRQLVEEMAELTQAICKFKRYGESENLIEELADVKVTLNGLIHLLECSNRVETIMDEKTYREISRYENINNPIH